MTDCFRLETRRHSRKQKGWKHPLEEINYLDQVKAYGCLALWLCLSSSLFKNLNGELYVVWNSPQQWKKQWKCVTCIFTNLKLMIYRENFNHAWLLRDTCITLVLTVSHDIALVLYCFPYQVNQSINSKINQLEG